MALIKKIEEVRPFLPVSYANKANNLPSFEMAEETYLVPILGNELYQLLSDSFSEDTLSPVLSALIKKCRAVIVPFAYSMDLPFIQTTLTDSGIKALENQSQRNAFKWEYNEVSEGLKARGYSAQESLILFLSNHSADYPLWAESEYNDPANFPIIRNGHDMKSVVTLQQPHRCYMLLRGLASTIEQLYLRENLGDEYYDALCERIVNNQVSETENRGLKLIRQSAARYLLRHAATEMSIVFGDNGFTLTDGAKIKDSSAEGKVSPSDTQVIRFMKDMENSAEILLQKAIDFLNRNATPTIMPEYYSSSKYEDPAAPPEPYLKNTTRKGLFAM